MAMKRTFETAFDKQASRKTTIIWHIMGSKQANSSCPALESPASPDLETPTSPLLESPASPVYQPASPVYSPTRPEPVMSDSETEYGPTSPVWVPGSPSEYPCHPSRYDHDPESSAYPRPTSTVYVPSPSPVYAPSTTPVYFPGRFRPGPVVKIERTSTPEYVQPSQTADLEAKVAELEARNAQLQSRNEAINTGYKSLMDQYIADRIQWKTHVQDAEADIQAKEAQIETFVEEEQCQTMALRSENEALVQENRELRIKRRKYTMENLDIQEDLDAVREENQQLWAQNEELRHLGDHFAEESQSNSGDWVEKIVLTDDVVEAAGKLAEEFQKADGLFVPTGRNINNIFDVVRAYNAYKESCIEAGADME